MRIFLPHFGQNMLFMDKVSNSETQMVTTDQSSELIPGDIILVEGKDFFKLFNGKTVDKYVHFYVR